MMAVRPSCLFLSFSITLVGASCLVLSYHLLSRLSDDRRLDEWVPVSRLNLAAFARTLRDEPARGAAPVSKGGHPGR